MAVMREMAWRIFAGEYNISDLEYTSGTDRPISYIVTPLGAKINRMFVVGVITDLENVGTDTEPMWRARVSDPTGVFYISAGQYQPEAAKALSKMRAPSFVAIIGKSRIYRPEDGGIYLSIRPEIVKEADESLRNLWVLEACKSLKQRVDAMNEVKKMSSPNINELKALGYSDSVADGILLAQEHYKDKFDIQRYHTMLRDSLKFITPEKRFAKMSETSPGPVDDTTDLDETDSEDIAEEMPAIIAPESKGGFPKDDKTVAVKEDKAKEEKENKILKLIGELDTTIKGVSYETIIERAKKESITQEELEDIFNSLLDKGVVYEPILGRVKLVKGS